MTETLAIRGGTPVVPQKQHHRWPVITVEDRAAVQTALDSRIVSGPYACSSRISTPCDVTGHLITSDYADSRSGW